MDSLAQHHRTEQVAHVINLEVVENILRPSVRVLSESDIVYEELQLRLKRVDDEIQNLIDQQDLKQLTDSKFLKKIVQDIKKNFTGFESLRRYGGSRNRKLLVSSFISCFQILQSIYNNHEYPGKEEDSENISSSIFEKGMILDALHRLEFLKNFLCLYGSWFFKHPKGYCDEYVIELLVIQLSKLFFWYLARVVDETKKEDVTSYNAERRLLKNVIGSIHDTVKCYHFNWEIVDRLRLQYNDTPSNIVDEDGVVFFDWLVDKLRKQKMSSGNFKAGEDEKDPIEATVEELMFLRDNLIVLFQLYAQEVSAVKEMESLSVSTLALIFEAACRIYSCFYGEKQDANDDSSLEEEADYRSYGLLGLLESVESLKKQAKDSLETADWSYGLVDLFESVDYFGNCKHFYLSSVIKTGSSSPNHPMESVDSLIETLQDLIVHDPPLIAPQMETLYHEMRSIRGGLICEIADDELGKSQMELLIAQVQEAACKCSLIIDSFRAGDGSLWYHMLGMFVFTNDVRAAGKEMKNILKEKIKPSSTNVHCNSLTNLVSFTAQSPVDINATVISCKDEKENPKSIGEASSYDLVGLKDSASEVIQILTQNSPQLTILSIVGMPGLGKTTLANSVYKHPSISFHFHLRAWCCVSQGYDRKTLLADILRQIVGQTNSSNEVRGEDCAQKLYQSLKGRKYLIVIDDIWDTEVWYDLKNIFPDDRKGSRILFTTRHRQVASGANSIPYALRLLSNKESCELLWSKIFGMETCPPELRAVSKRIARHCKGLPLLITVMSGILKSKERRKESWEQFAEEVTGLSIKRGKYWDKMEFTNILELSYMHLPDYLKSCFLHFGTFEEDTAIPVSHLIRLWISEGFVQGNLDLKSLEVEAKSYLDELIDRSLVMIAKRSSDGGVKACCIHDVLRDFCIYSTRVMPGSWIAEPLHKDYIVQQEPMFDGLISLHGHIPTRSIYYERCNQGSKFAERAGFTEVLFMSKPIMNRLCKTEWQSVQSNYNFLLWHEFLLVLDLGNVRVESGADSSDLIMIATLIHLRYLSIRIRTTEIPSDIGNLRNLETLIITGAIGYILLPESVWNLFQLRNILMNHGFFDFQHFSKTFFDNFVEHDNLKSVSTLSLRHGDDVDKLVLSKLTGIKKLGCKFYADSWDDSRGCSLFPDLDFMSELVSLKVIFSGKVQYPYKISFPSNLRKLSISNSRLPWEELSVIGRQLPNLEVLKLLNKAFEGQQWDMIDGEFQKLKFLKLDFLEIEVWNACAEHLPCLEQLVVSCCPQLLEIPSSFGEISTLQSIEVKWCSPSAITSVNQILELQLDLGNPQFNVTLVSLAS
ncbi:OLC1v1017551C1 [Oldenlandia corymbosa var. corymbosa]|uniref:OLC1v1017551C1 n=1 Tax=Oldenlandia corymbosa var. corymbosa TaxID=529605 RepID=A0AAV1E9M8_OLDCO|nr:OLC1v1017551C1 [Oldenlandia corymbosa var. corymbosa]